jgi:subtilisin-like proprotein convertase family protein
MIKSNQFQIRALAVIFFLFSNVCSAQIFWDQACKFTSHTDNITVPHSESLDLTGSMTIEMWVYPFDDLIYEVPLIRKGVTADYSINLRDGQVIFSHYSSYTIWSSSILPFNRWSHIAVKYNDSNSYSYIYINGILDVSWHVSHPYPPNPHGDALIIGGGFEVYHLFFSGYIDNIRIWDTALTSTQINNFYRSIIATNSGKFSHLVLSMPFQPDNSAGDDFTLRDMTSRSNDGINHGVTAYDLSNRPSITTAYNDCVELDGELEYLSAPSNDVTSPASEITLEAWVQPVGQVDFNNYVIILKGLSPNMNTARYAMTISREKNEFTIRNTINGNNNFVSPPYPISSNNLSQWTHVAFTYSAFSGKYNYFVNGELIGFGFINMGNIYSSSNDSLFIGNGFEGYIDEVRISNKAKSASELQEYMFTSIEDGNDFPGVTEAVYNFDGYLTNSADDGPALKFRNTADFSHSAVKNNRPLSPLIRDEDFNNAFYLSDGFQRIPSDNLYSYGVTYDSIYINENASITDINVYLAMNHTEENSLRIVLYSPGGDSCILFDQNEFKSETDNIVTIFDDQGYSVFYNLYYVAITPRIIPEYYLSDAFQGANTRGYWRLKIYDLVPSDIGMLYSWGIQINNNTDMMMTAEIKTCIQGFYNDSFNTVIPDTVLCNLRKATSPYELVDKSRALSDSAGNLLFFFPGSLVLNNTNYFIQLSHRNSIETWSTSFHSFTDNIMTYDFTTASNKAYGNNMIQVDNLPDKFAIYGGDVNQDGTIDATDVSSIDNDAQNFVSGYVVTDLTGDDFVDGTDFAIADNNAANFVSAITP